MRSVRFNDALHIIQAQGFSGTRVRSLVFPSALRRLGIGAFQECESLEVADFTAAERLQHMGLDTFGECLNLRSVLFSGRLTYVGRGYFLSTGSEQQAAANAPSDIAEQVFEGCDSLGEVRLNVQQGDVDAYDESGDEEEDDFGIDPAQFYQPNRTLSDPAVNLNEAARQAYGDRLLLQEMFSWY